MTESRFDRVWRWHKTLAHRHGHRCRILAPGALNSCLVEFADGCRFVASRNAVRKCRRPHQPTRSPTKKKGICFVCGCTERDACLGGCAWANVKQTLCTACAPLNTEARAIKRSIGLEILENRVSELQARARLLIANGGTYRRRR